MGGERGSWKSVLAVQLDDDDDDDDDDNDDDLVLFKNY